MKKDIIDRLQNVVDGDPEQVFSPNAWAPELSALLEEAIAELTRLRGDPSKDKSFGRFDRVTPILAADKDNGLIRIVIGSREDGPFVVKRDQVLEVRWAEGQVELVRRQRL